MQLLHQNIKFLRNHNNMSLSIVASKLGVDAATIHKKEDGKIKISSDDLMRFSILWHISIDVMVSIKLTCENVDQYISTAINVDSSAPKFMGKNEIIKIKSIAPQNIKFLRSKYGWTLANMATIAGRTRQSWARWESENTSPPIDALCAICRASNVSLDALMFIPLARDNIDNYPACILNGNEAMHNCKINGSIEKYVSVDEKIKFDRSDKRQKLISYLWVMLFAWISGAMVAHSIYGGILTSIISVLALRSILVSSPDRDDLGSINLKSAILKNLHLLSNKRVYLNIAIYVLFISYFCFLGILFSLMQI